MTTDLTPDSMALLCKRLKEAVQVNLEAKPVIRSMVETLMDHQVRQDQWGSILFCVWQAWQDEPNPGSGVSQDGTARSSQA